MNSNNKRLFLFNSASGVIQLILSLILIFISIPILLKNLGDTQYGIFCAVSVIGNLSIFANIGLDSSLIKFISEQGKSQESDYDIITTLIILIAIFLPITICIYFLKDSILLNLLKVPEEYLIPSTILLKYLLIANLMLLIGRVFSAILDSKHKIYLTNLYTFIYNTIYWGGIIVVILYGHGLEAMGIVILIAALIWLILISFSGMKYWGKINLNGFFRNFKRIAKKQLSYGIKIYTGTLLNFLYEPLTKILISNLIGISYVGFYEITLKVKGNLLTLFSKLLYPIYPIIAHEQSTSRLKALIMNFTKMLFYIIIPIIVILIFCMKPFITLWISENVEILTISTVILVSLNLLLVTTVTPIYIYLRLKNYPEKEIYIQGANVVINLLVIGLSFNQLGYYSIILANALSLIIPFSMCIYYQKKYLNFYPFSGVKDLLKYISIFIFIGLVAAGFSLVFQQISWPNIFYISIIVCLVSLVAFHLTGILKKDVIPYFLKH